MRNILITSGTPYRKYGKDLVDTFDEVVYTHGTLNLAQYNKYMDKTDRVTAFGGGEAIDIAKYIGAGADAEVVAIPTILSTDAMFTDATGYREDGTVKYVPTKKPDITFWNFERMLQAPGYLNAAGCADVLSGYIAVHEWKEKDGYNIEVANEMIDLITQLDPPTNVAGLRKLAQSLKREVELCEIVGNADPEEGNEHQIAYELENRLRDRNPPLVLPHGVLVATGILELSGWYDELCYDYMETKMRDLGMYSLVGYDDMVAEVVEEVMK